MIACDKECVHQKEGYCGLNTITSLSMETDDKCGYFETKKTNGKGNGSFMSGSEHSKSL